MQDPFFTFTLTNPHLEITLILLVAFIFGAVFGSFACCQAWRIHERQNGKNLGSRSICLSCKTK